MRNSEVAKADTLRTLIKVLLFSDVLAAVQWKGRLRLHELVFVD